MNKTVGIYGGILFFLLGFFISLHSHAGVLIEPFLGYDQETINATPLAGSGFDVKNNGLSYGARLGYRFSGGLWLAGEYAGGNGDSKSSAAGATGGTYSKAVTAAVIGYDVDRFRVWGAYGFSNKNTFKDDSGETEFTGSLMKIGVGYKLMKSLSLDFEYLIPKYDKIKSSGAEVNASDVFSKFDSSVLSLSLGFPYDFAGK